MGLGEFVEVPEYKRQGQNSWRLIGKRRGQVVYISPHFITVDWGDYRETLRRDDMAKRIYKGGTH